MSSSPFQTTENGSIAFLDMVGMSLSRMELDVAERFENWANCRDPEMRFISHYSKMTVFRTASSIFTGVAVTAQWRRDIVKVGEDVHVINFSVDKKDGHLIITRFSLPHNGALKMFASISDNLGSLQKRAKE